MSRLAVLVALCGCVGMLSVPPSSQGSRVPAIQHTAGGCSPDSGELAQSYVSFYRLAAASINDDVWAADRAKLRLSTQLDSNLVVAETDDAVCAAAHAMYATHFRTSSLDRVVVIKLDTVRAIIRDRYEAVPDTTIKTGVNPNLITNASFTAVIDTIWY